MLMYTGWRISLQSTVFNLLIAIKKLNKANVYVQINFITPFNMLKKLYNKPEMDEIKSLRMTTVSKYGI